jgi:hypothetical protein
MGMRFSSFIVLAVLVVTAGACGEEPSAPTSAGGEFAGEAFPTDPIGGEGHFECVEGERVRVYAFSTTAERDRAAAALDPADASRVGQASVAWKGNPIFWRSGDRELVMYAGADRLVIDHLDERLGERVSEGRGRPSSPDAFPC